MRYALIELALRGMSATGLDRMFARRFAGLGAILTFHHVRVQHDRRFPANRLLHVTPGFLEATLRTVRELGYAIVPMDEVPARLADPDPSRPFVALTFDDGYRDTRDVALPILRRYEAPCTVYAVPGFVDRTAPLWWEDLEDAFRALERVEIELPDGRFVHTGRNADEKVLGFRRLYWRLRTLSEPTLRRIVAELAESAGVDSRARVERLCLDAAELRQLARDPLVTIGAHTLSHPRLATLDDAAAQDEIEGSRARLARDLGREIAHFAYPVGDPASAGGRDFALAEAAGFATAVTTRPGVLFPEHAEHLHALPRISMNGLFQKPDYLRALLSGLPTAVKNLGRRVNVA